MAAQSRKHLCLYCPTSPCCLRYLREHLGDMEATASVDKTDTFPLSSHDATVTEIVLFASYVESVTAANEAMVIGVPVRSDTFVDSRAFKVKSLTKEEYTAYLGCWRVNGGVIDTGGYLSGFDYSRQSSAGPGWLVAKGVGLPSADNRRYRLVLGECKPLSVVRRSISLRLFFYCHFDTLTLTMLS